MDQANTAVKGANGHDIGAVRRVLDLTGRHKGLEGDARNAMGVHGAGGLKVFGDETTAHTAARFAPLKLRKCIEWSAFCENVHVRRRFKVRS